MLGTSITSRAGKEMLATAGTQCTTAGCGYWQPTGELVTSIWDAGTTIGETISPEVR